MITKLVALILLGSVSLIHTAEDSQQISLTVAKVGDNVTFQCPVPGKENKLFYWLKQPVGYLAQTVADLINSRITINKHFKDSHFTVRQEENLYLLTITNVTKEDEAVYFCQSGAALSKTSVNGSFLSVNDPNQNQLYVKQSLKTESVRPGGSVTVECSLLSKSNDSRVQCPGKHSVYWFRSGSHGFNPGLIYTQRNSNDEQRNRSCVYSLTRTIQNLSDAGTYYCAVVTCGQILFGEGTNVKTGFLDSETSLDPLVLGLGVLLACCGTVIIILICFINQRKGCLSNGSLSDSLHEDHNTSAVYQSNVLDDEATAMSYAALNFTKRGVNIRKKKELPQEALYSIVRSKHSNQ